MGAHTRKTKSDIAFFHPYRVRWADVDPQGIVFNPNYFVFFDDAWNEYLRNLGFPYPHGLAALGIDFVAVRSEATFHAPARFDDELLTGVRVAAFGRSSLTVEYSVWRGETLLNEGAIAYVGIDLGTHRPRSLPADFIRRVGATEIAAPIERTKAET